MTNAHLDLGRMWLERDRPEKAEPELRRALSLDPEDAVAHALLAGALVDLRRSTEGLAEADTAIGLAPAWDLPLRLKAFALLRLERLPEAEAVGRSALLLDPEEPANHGMLAMVLLGRKRAKEALAAAEAGLALDPEHVDCINVRARAMIQLGDAAGAELALGAALAQNPEDAHTHLNLGWASLNAGKPDEAMRHYTEALRLDPQNEVARAGLVEALKARNPIYRLFLWWFLLLARLPPGIAFGILIGTVFARKIIADAAEANPSLAPFLWTLFWGLVAFILMTWIAVPLFNLTLRLHRHGRLALAPDQLRQSNWLLGLLLAAGAFLGMWFAGVPFGGSSAPAMAAAMLAVLALVVVNIVTLERPLLRRGAWVGVLVLAGIGAVATTLEYGLDHYGMELDSYVERLPQDIRTDDAAIDREIARWPQADQQRFSALVAEYPERKDTRKRCDGLVNFFIYAFVAFTWLAPVLHARDRPVDA